MTNTSSCFDIPDEDDKTSKNRSQASWNRWKTLYKVSVKGLADPEHLYFRYDGTAVTTTMTDDGNVLASAQRLDLSEWNASETDESNWKSFLGVDSNDSGVVRASDLVYSGRQADEHPEGSVPEGGNVRITLKPGYYNPVLTAVTGRTNAGVDSAACGTNETCRVVKTTPSTDGSDGGTVTYAWTPTFVSDESLRGNVDRDKERIGTSVAEPVEITATRLTVPVLTMAGDDSGNPTGAASDAVVPAQWEDATLTPGSADMEAGRFIRVTGSAPVPEGESLTFAGYRLVGSTCADAANGTTCEAAPVELSAKNRYFPGDAIDLEVLRLTYGLNLVGHAERRPLQRPVARADLRQARHLGEPARRNLLRRS